jgi:fatty acid CoA ligase FadD9
MNSTEKMMSDETYIKRITKLMTTDPELVAMFPDFELHKTAVKELLPTEQAVDILLEGYADRPALGMRDYIITDNTETGKRQRQYQPSFGSISYGEFRSRVKSIANFWHKHSTLNVRPNEFVCTIGFTSIDYAAVDLACLYAQAVSVPLQSTTSGTDFDEIFANVEPAAVAATVADIVTATEHVIRQGGVRSLIVFDFDERDETDSELYAQAEQLLASSDCTTTLITLDKLVELGEQFDWQFLPPHPEGPERMAMILHSSGSTGKPKGAMISEAAIAKWWLDDPERYPTVSVMFMPLNHGMGKLALTFILRKGSTAYFTVKPDMSTLFEDIRIARPTMLSFFPRVFELIYQHYQNEVASLVKSGVDEDTASQQVKEDMRFSYLGDRLMAGLVGSAPTPQIVKDFIVDCFQLPLKEGYGNTEAGSGSITMDDIIQRPNVTDYKLVDVPELGYFATDKPYPRGELCYKAQHAVKGYYKDPEATAALLDGEGFTLTGDIVEERGPDHVVLIDRRKDVLKLSQGEYVAVGPLGTIFEAGSAVIEQIYIYGNSNKAYLVAVVVPGATAVSSALGENPSQHEVKKLIRDELQKVARNQQMKSFEVPRDFIIEPEPFSAENGLLSSVRKRLRPQLKVKYGVRLEALYEEQDRKQQQSISELKDPSCSLSILEKLTKLIAIELSLEQLDSTSPSTFAELGGDSLGAVSFSLAIEDVFDVSIAGDSILSPTGCLRKWAGEIENQLSDDDKRADFTEIHKKNASRLDAKDLSLDRFLGEEWLDQISSCQPLEGNNKTVLLTGANGFLGRAVCMQWLEKLSQIDGKLICIIRARDDNSAKARLEQVFSDATPELKMQYQSLADKHLEVIAGDAGEKYLGVGEKRFSELAQQVDRICHVAALVNHRLAYQHLFGPNVAGTAEIIRLATTFRKKGIDFVSTEGVIPLLDPTAENNEEALPRESVPLADTYAAGYASSKWAGEVLLRNANEQCGIPVNILRGNMMLAHQHYPGQINTADMFTRLLFSVVTTGLAPQSFYPIGMDGTKQQGHYDGLPVNIVAATVIAAADFNNSEQCLAFNINNYHNDGCSLDSFVDWIESAGNDVTRIDDYQAWFDRFRDKLNTLPEKQRQQSALEILGAYEQPDQLSANLRIDCNNFKKIASSLDNGQGIPHLDEAFIHKCLRDMSFLGVL